MNDKPPINPSLIALKISGDFGGYTWYQNKNGRTVAYPASPALQPASLKQAYVRGRFAVAMQSWRSLPLPQRRNYSAACDFLALCMWGANLYCYLALTDDGSILTTLRAQTGIDLVTPPDLTSAAMATDTPERAQVEAWIARHQQHLAPP